METKKTKNPWRTATFILGIVVLIFIIGEIIQTNSSGYVISEKNLDSITKLANEKGWDIISIVNIETGENKIMDMFTKNEKCNKIYAGVCFDKESPFYKCNIKEESCDSDDWVSALTMKFMEENNIVIYGSSSCGWCKKQKEEFGNLIDYLDLNSLYVDCANPSNKNICADVKGTPSWKQNEKIVHAGYMPLKEIIPAFN